MKEEADNGILNVLVMLLLWEWKKHHAVKIYDKIQNCQSYSTSSDFL